jgi:hypothetical protein
MMTALFQEITLDTGDADDRAVLVLRDGRLTAVLSHLSSMHDEMAGMVRRSIVWKTAAQTEAHVLGPRRVRRVAGDSGSLAVRSLGCGDDVGYRLFSEASGIQVGKALMGALGYRISFFSRDPLVRFALLIIRTIFARLHGSSPMKAPLALFSSTPA